MVQEESNQNCVLKESDIGFEGVMKIDEALITNTVLKKLSLSGFKIV